MELPLFVQNHKTADLFFILKRKLRWETRITQYHGAGGYQAMHRVIETEQIQLVYESAERCKRCREIVCKQPAYVEVVYCPRFIPVDNPVHTAKKVQPSHNFP